MAEALVAAWSGGMAAVASTILVYPVDTVLVRYQSTRPSTFRRTGRISGMTRDIVSIVKQILTEKDGDKIDVRNIYKGLEFKMAESLIRNFVYFYWHQTLKRMHMARIGRISTTANLLLASLAGILSQCVTAPLEVISTNLQTSHMNLRTVIKSIFEKEGIRGFYRGFGASLILCSNPAITNATFDRLKLGLQLLIIAHMSREWPTDLSSGKTETIRTALPDLTGVQSFVLGALSKAVATVITYPYIRIKVLVQAQNIQKRIESISCDMDEVAAETTSSYKAATAEVNSQETGKALYHCGQGSIDSLGDVPSEAALPSDDASFNVVKHVNKAFCHRSPSALLVDADILKAASFCLSEIGDPVVGVSTDDTSLYVGIEKQHSVTVWRSDSTLSEGDKNVVGVLVSTVMQDGFRGLYKGLGLQLFKTVLAAAILYMVKEKTHIMTEKVLRWLILMSRRRKNRLSSTQ